MGRWLSSTLVATFASLGLVSSAHAAAPNLLPIEGHIADNAGVAVEGAHDLAFTLYDAPTAGNALYAETRAGLSIVHGDFIVYLGELTGGGTDAGAPDGGAGVDLAKFRDNGSTWGEAYVIDGTETVAPRFRLATAPYVAYSQYCGEAASLSTQAAIPTGVGIGTTPAAGSASTLGGNLTFADTGGRTVGFLPTNAPGEDLTIQAGGSVSNWGNAVFGGQLILKAGNANKSGSSEPCTNGPYQNSVKIFAGDNVFSGICGTELNGNIEFYAGNGQPMRMLIVGDSGDVGIGTATPAHTLEVNGSVAGNGAYVQLSDGRYKTAVAPITNAIDKIERLRGVTFDWRQEDFPGMRFESGHQLGFIAQELKDVLPEAVSTDAKGTYSVAYSKVIPVLVEGIKEQNQLLQAASDENRRLDRELRATRDRQAAIEARLARLEASAPGPAKR